MIKFKPKGITEKLFTKENVFQWIETLEEAVIALDKLKEICNDHSDCENCPFTHWEDSGRLCQVFERCRQDSGDAQNELKNVLKQLYYTVEENKWEDEE